MFVYQKTNRYFAQIAEGLEGIGAEELAALGATEVKPAFRGIYFTADREILYRINYLTRLCQRIMAPLATFDCHSTKYLHQTAIKLPWHELLSPDQTFAIVANVSNSKISHSRYAALCLKDAIADYFRERSGKRPSVDTHNPEVSLNLHLDRNKATISIDTSGGSLHRRGYRQESCEAPMQETLAAAIITFSGWDGTKPLLDPMCGSGTLLCEALLRYCHIPAGFLRKRFGFESLPDFDPTMWRAVKKEADGNITALNEGIISGRDLSSNAVRAARKNIALLPNGRQVAIARQPFQEIERAENMIIVCNPPYGIRSGKETDIPALVGEFGSFLKHRCKGSEAYLYFGDRELLKHIGLRPAWKKPLQNGGLDGVLAKYQMY